MESTTFRILNLPLLAIQNILRILDTSQLIDFAFLSKKCRAIVQSLRPKRNTYKLSACFQPNYYVLLIPPCQGYGVRISEEEMKTKRNYFGVGIAPTAESIITLMQVWTDFLSNMFNCAIYSLCMNNQVCAGYYDQIVTWLNTRQPSLPCFIFESDSHRFLSHEDFKFILDNFKSTDKLEIHHKPTENFRYTGQLDTKEMYLNCSEWFTAQHLMNSKKAIEIELVSSNLQPTDLNLFLKSWVAGEFPNLQNIKIETTFFAENAIMDGLKVTRLEGEAPDELQSRVGWWEDLIGGYEIQDANRIRARLTTASDARNTFFYFSVIDF